MNRKQIIKNCKDLSVDQFRDYLLSGPCKARGPCKVRDGGYRCGNCILTKHMFKLIRDCPCYGCSVEECEDRINELGCEKYLAYEDNPKYQHLIVKVASG